MPINLQKDCRKIREHIRQRVRDHDSGKHHGPGNKSDPITQITIGYAFDQAGWVAMVFDTRSRAKPDGEWNSYIEESAIEFPDWWQAFEALVEEDSPIEFVLVDETRKS